LNHKITHSNNFLNVSFDIEGIKTEDVEIVMEAIKNEQKYRLKLLLKEGLLTAPKLYKNSKLYVLDEVLSDEVYQYLDIFKNRIIDKFTSPQ